MKCVLVLFLASMMATVNSCEFGNDAIQGMYDRAEVFRKTKTFDTTNQTVPLRQHHAYDYREKTNGIKELGMKINDEYMWENYKNNTSNEIETINGSYIYFSKSRFDFWRDKNSELIFENVRNRDVKFIVPSIDAELPNNVEEEYKQVLLALKTMRQKMFDFQKGLSKDDVERVYSFEYFIFPEGEFSSLYIENGGAEISVDATNEDGIETISGRISCNNKYQKYNVVDGKVAVDGELY